MSLPPAAAAIRSSRKPKGEGHARRGEILDATGRIFVEHGYEGATIRKIADEVGLSSTALYMHFPDKRAILAEICREAFETLLEQSRRIAQSEASPEDKLYAMVAGYARFALKHPNAYSLIYMTRPSEAKEGAEDAAQAMGAELFREFLAPVEQLDRDGRLTQSVEVAAQALWASAHGVVSLRITKLYLAWAEAETLCRLTADALLARLLR